MIQRSRQVFFGVVGSVVVAAALNACGAKEAEAEDKAKKDAGSGTGSEAASGTEAGSGSTAGAGSAGSGSQTTSTGTEADCAKAAASGLALHECADPRQDFTAEEKALYPDPAEGACVGKAETNLTDVSADQTVNGLVNVKASVTIKSGATLTAGECALFRVAKDAVINVEGSFKITGKADSLAFLEPSGTAETDKWGGIQVRSGGSLDMDKAFLRRAKIGVECKTGAALCKISGSTLKDDGQPVKLGAKATIEGSTLVQMGDKGVRIEAGGDVTISNSHLYTSLGDVIGQFGGRLVVTKSKVGGTAYEHCAVHTEGGESIVMSDNLIMANAYAFMLAPMAEVKITHNNIAESKEAHLLKIGTGKIVSPDLSNNYWEGGLPQSFVTSPDVEAAKTEGALTTPITGLGPSF